MKNNYKYLIINISIIILILVSTARASVINFKDCGTNSTQIDRDRYEEYRFEIDLKKRIVKNVQILTDKELKSNKIKLDKILYSDKATNEEKSMARSIFGFPKISTIEYIIEYEDKNYITAKNIDNIFDSGNLETTITIYLKEKKVNSKVEFVKKNKIKTHMSEGVNFFCK